MSSELLLLVFLSVAATGVACIVLVQIIGKYRRRRSRNYDLVANVLQYVALITVCIMCMIAFAYTIGNGYDSSFADAADTPDVASSLRWQSLMSMLATLLSFYSLSGLDVVDGSGKYYVYYLCVIISTVLMYFVI